ncbi:MAG: hypothetical protein Kow0090_01660 [Myxococcota bacterium]
MKRINTLVRILTRFLFFLFFSSVASISCSKGCFHDKDTEEKKAFEKIAPMKRERYPEIIDVADFASNPKVRKTVFDMPIMEIGRRTGDHKYFYESTLNFTGVKGKKVKIHDRTELTTAGVRDFYLKRESSKGRGMEMWWIGNMLYTGDIGGPYRERQRDEQFAWRFRRGTYRALTALLSVLGDEVKYTPKGVQTINGISAYRFGLALKDELSPPKKVEFPETEEGREAESEAAKLENENTPFGLEHFAKKSKPVELKGDIWVQEGGGVIVKSELIGKTFVGSKFNVELEFDFRSEMDTRGEFKPILPPKVEPAPRAAKVPEDPLEFYKRTGQAPEKRAVTEEAKEQSTTGAKSN